MLQQAAILHEVKHQNSTGQHDEVGHPTAMAAPPDRFGTRDRRARGCRPQHAKSNHPVIGSN
jgi:hypothetical protein